MVFVRRIIAGGFKAKALNILDSFHKMDKKMFNKMYVA